MPRVDVYGFRPESLHHLPPWEFTPYYSPVRLRPPCHEGSLDRTLWLPGGLVREYPFLRPDIGFALEIIARRALKRVQIFGKNQKTGNPRKT